MLSDRIKKFGIKSQENNETGQASSLKEHENPKLSTARQRLKTRIRNRLKKRPKIPQKLRRKRKRFAEIW